MIQKNNFFDRGWLGGVAMASPFYAEFFSWDFSIFLSVPFFLNFIFYRERINNLSFAVFPIILLIGLHALALIFSPTRFYESITKELVIAIFLLIIYSFSQKEMLSGFYFCLIPLALVTALLGLLKAAMLDRGYLFDFILQGCSSYPLGSSLCMNYNNLGLIWLIATLGCMRKKIWIFIPILLAAGALVGSRRFIVLMALLPLIYFFIAGRTTIIKSIFIAFFSISLIQLISHPSSFEKFRFGDNSYKTIKIKNMIGNFFNYGEIKASSFEEVYVDSINRSTPSAMLGTMKNKELGTNSRLDLWRMGLSLLAFLPQGWSYHEIFSCAFAACQGYSYPHMSIISEWIIGGAIFGIIGLLFYILPFYYLILSRNIPAFFLYFISIPYSLISGDTVFSLPICVACVFVALSGIPRDSKINTLRFRQKEYPA